mgnify:CR=1 FL=1|jgi:hypothetical protein
MYRKEQINESTKKEGGRMKRLIGGSIGFLLVSTGLIFGVFASPFNYIGDFDRLNSKSQSSGSDTKPLNYPNPFIGSEGTEIAYQLSEHQDITIYIYSLNGQLIEKRELEKGEEGTFQGENTVFFSSDLAVGIYPYFIVKTSTQEVLGKSKLGVIR